MIIKLTLNDNDFGEILGGFCRSLEKGYPLPCPPRDTKPDLLIQYFHASQHFNELYHAHTLPPEEKTWFCDQITQAWAHRVRHNKDSDYLTKNFECSFVDSMTGEWENGESFYFFPGGYGNKVINL